MIVKETQHFIFHYTEFDQKCIDEISDVLEASYNRITSNFNQELQKKVIIEIFPNHKQLHTALGLTNAPDWIRGGVQGDKIIIASPLNPPPGSDFYNVINTGVHEFVHIIVNIINKNIPRWLSEGIAGYEAKDNNQQWIIETVRCGLTSNHVPTFKDLDTRDDFESFFKLNGYQYSYTIVESIVEIFGYDKLLRLIKAPNDFMDIFEMTEEEIQDKWKKYIKLNYL